MTISMNQAAIVSLRIGRSGTLLHGGKEIASAIAKHAVDRPLQLGPLGFSGDEQADTEHHGGPDKAVCVYPSERYAYWKQHIGATFESGAFGENVTSAGLLEEDVHIGDTFRLGEALVQISQPRQPCFKLAARHGWKELPLLLQQTGYTGFYFRVIEPGEVAPSSSFERVAAHPLQVSVQSANRMMYRDKKDKDGILQLLAVDALSASWRRTLQGRLED